MNIMKRLGPAGYEVAVQSVTVVAHEAVMLSVVQAAYKVIRCGLLYGWHWKRLCCRISCR